MARLNRWAVAVVVGLALATAMAGCAKPQFKQRAKWAPHPKQPDPPPPAKPMPIDPALESRAAEELDRALRSNAAVIRAHAIEALKNIGGEGVEEAILKGLEDDSAMVRFAAAMAAGERKVAAAKPRLEQMAEDRNANVQVAVRYALHRLGDYRRSRDLETFATHPQTSIRANTAMVLGLLGEPSGLNILNGMVRDSEPAVLLQVHEARWRLGDMSGLKNLVAASASAYPDYQIVAATAMAGPRDKRVVEHVRSMLTAEHAEVQLAAARAMGMLGLDDGYTIAARAARDSDPRLQVLAALAFGEIGRNDAQPYLAPMLDSRTPDVRLAAAAAILRLAQKE